MIIGCSELLFVVFQWIVPRKIKNNTMDILNSCLLIQNSDLFILTVL